MAGKAPSFHLSVLAGIVVLLASGLVSCSNPGRSGESGPSGKAAFRDSVKPLFEERCVWCHGDGRADGGLNLQDRGGVLSPTQRFLVPGKAEESRIYQALTLESVHPRVMPGDGWGISRSQLAAMRVWIDSGARWPEGEAGRIERKPLRVEHDDFR